MQARHCRNWMRTSKNKLFVAIQVSQLPWKKKSNRYKNYAITLPYTHLEFFRILVISSSWNKKNSTKPGFEHFLGWSIHNFSGKLVPVPHHLLSKYFPPNINLNHPSFCYLMFYHYTLCHRVPLTFLSDPFKTKKTYTVPSHLQGEQPQFSVPCLTS